MPTTIDSLQIEIQSNSTNAATGIRDLAKSLGELKNSGSVNTAIKNLDKLSASLKGFVSASNATHSIGKLVVSLSKLKEVGSVNSIANSLSKLSTGLKSLENVNIGNIAPQVQRIADAVAPLSSLKAGGLNSMVNAMSKIEKVTQSLDDSKIAAFSERIEKLNTALEPLSAKMTTIQTGLKGINTNAKSAGSSIKDMGEKVDGASINLSSFIYTIQEAVGWIQQAILKFSELIHQASQWDGIEYQFGNTFGEQADEYYEKITKITDALSINKQMFMENSAMAGSMLIGFGVGAEDAREMGVGYTELAYDIWAAFNNVYKTLDGADGAMAAIRSAIAGEVEPIRRAGFTIVESMLEETAASHGLEISIEKATEAQKSYLRYLTLVDQAQSKGIIGTYASEMKTAEGMMRTFKQQLVSLTQAFGSLFLPILVKVMPYVQAFIELLTEGVHYLADMLGIEIQKVDFSDYKTGADAVGGVADSANGAADALGSAAKAAKDLKKATLGIDELNVISPSSSTSGSGSSGSGVGGTGFEGLDVSSIWDDSIFAGIGNQVDEIKEKLRGWMPVIATVAAGLAGLRLLKLIDDIKKIASLGGAVTAVGGAFKGIKEFFEAAKQMAPEVGWLAALFPKLSGWFASAGTAISSAATAVGTFLAGITAPAWVTIAAIVAAIASAAYFLYENWDKVVKVFKEFIDSHITPKLEEMKKHLDKIKEVLSPLLDILKPIFDAVADFFAGIDWKGIFGTIGDGLLKFVEILGGVVFGVISSVVAGAFNQFVSALENIVQWVSGVVQVIGGAIEFIIALFSGGDIKAAAQKIVDGIADVFGGLWGFITGPIVAFYEGVIGWFTKLWDELVGHSIVPDTIDAIVDCFLSLGDLIFKPLEKFADTVMGIFENIWGFIENVFSSIGDTIGGIWDGITGLFGGGEKKDETYSVDVIVPDIKGKLSAAWTEAKTWWEQKKAKLADYTPSIGSIKDKLSSAWSSAKTWWDSKKSKLKEYTPSIGSIYTKLKERWDSARDWYNNKKAKLKEYTPSIGSIYEKVYARWKNARDWWNSKKGSFKTYTPSIGSITDKLKSAWNSAKKWWNNNVKLSTKLNIQVPTIKVKWDTATAFGKSFKYPTGFSLKFAADGGIFDQGSLIWAGERGAEVVANAGGGKTGVMNVQQMQDAVYEGVYAAVVAAMRGNSEGGSQSVNVYLDGRQITAAVEQRQRERGASIMGNQVYSY